MRRSVCLLACFALVAVSATAQTAPIRIAADTVLDGRGKILKNVRLVVEDGRIKAVDSTPGPATYDLRGLTLMPGWIDTHVHITTHFGRDGRAESPGETPVQAMLHAAENAWMTLIAGFTTMQSLGSPAEKDLREAIARGRLPGPRLLTSLGSINGGTPDAIRARVRQFNADAADLVKVFASRSSREGGGAYDGRCTAAGGVRRAEAPRPAHCRPRTVRSP